MGVMKRLLEYKMYGVKPSLRDFDVEDWIFKKEVGQRLKSGVKKRVKK